MKLDFACHFCIWLDIKIGLTWNFAKWVDVKVSFTFDGTPIFGINLGEQSVVNNEAIYPSIHPSFQICTSPKMSSHLISSHLLSIQVSKSVNSTLSYHPMSSFTVPSTNFKICTTNHCHLISHLISSYKSKSIISSHTLPSIQIWKSVQVQKFHLISYNLTYSHLYPSLKICTSPKVSSHLIHCHPSKS